MAGSLGKGFISAICVRHSLKLAVESSRPKATERWPHSCSYIVPLTSIPVPRKGRMYANAVQHPLFRMSWLSATLF